MEREKETNFDIMNFNGLTVQCHSNLNAFHISIYLIIYNKLIKLIILFMTNRKKKTLLLGIVKYPF